MRGVVVFSLASFCFFCVPSFWYTLDYHLPSFSLHVPIVPRLLAGIAPFIRELGNLSEYTLRDTGASTAWSTTEAGQPEVDSAVLSSSRTHKANLRKILLGTPYTICTLLGPVVSDILFTDAALRHRSIRSYTQCA